MKRILIITEHPAPYWDRTISVMKELAHVRVIYIKMKVSSKPWDNIEFERGVHLNLLSFPGVLKMILSSDQIILGGIYLKRLLLLLMCAKIFLKKISLFSDVPAQKTRSQSLIKIKVLLYKCFNYILVSGTKGLEIYETIYGINKSKLIYFPYAWDERTGVPINFDERPLRVFISNRFIERKGYETILELIKILNEDRSVGNFSFSFAGDGPMLEYYKKKTEEIMHINFQFLGWISYDDYIKELENCHIFIHASCFEPFGIPVLDALSRGKIVISSDGVMSAYDFIENNQNGFLYNNQRPFELITILLNILKGQYDLSLISIKASTTLPKYFQYIENYIEHI